MNWRDKLSASLRQYLDRDQKTRIAIHVTSPDSDHASWDEWLKNKKVAIYIDGFDAPHHGSEERAKNLIYFLKLWRSLSIHGDLKPSNILLTRQGNTDRPPRTAKFVLLLIPKKNREHLVGDLEEEYRTKVLPEWGRFRAQFFYWEQTAIAVLCYLWPVLRRILGLAAIWKVIGR